MSASVAYLAPAIRSKGFIAVNDNAKRDNEQTTNDIMRVLGRLEATVSGMGNDISEMKQSIGADILEMKNDANRREDSSTESRRRLHEKFDSIREGLQRTNGTVQVLGKLVDRQGKDIEALTKAQTKTAAVVASTAGTVKKWTLRGGLVVGALASLSGGAAYLVKTNWIAIWNFVNQFVPKQ